MANTSKNETNHKRTNLLLTGNCIICGEREISSKRGRYVQNPTAPGQRAVYDATKVRFDDAVLQRMASFDTSSDSRPNTVHMDGPLLSFHMTFRAVYTSRSHLSRVLNSETANPCTPADKATEINNSSSRVVRVTHKR